MGRLCQRVTVEWGGVLRTPERSFLLPLDRRLNGYRCRRNMSSGTATRTAGAGNLLLLFLLERTGAILILRRVEIVIVVIDSSDAWLGDGSGYGHEQLRIPTTWNLVNAFESCCGFSFATDSNLQLYYSTPFYK